MDLLAIAKKYDQDWSNIKPTPNISISEIDLAIAWINNEISDKAVLSALEQYKNKDKPKDDVFVFMSQTTALSKIAKALKEAYKQKIINVTRNEKPHANSN